MNLRKFYTRKAIGFIIVLVLLGSYAFFKMVIQDSGTDGDTQENQKPVQVVEPLEPAEQLVQRGYMNATYMIDGNPVQLRNGYAETESVPGSASKTITRVFGNELITDLDGDEDQDVALIITQETGGSGIFYYAVAAIRNLDDYAGSDGYLLGDRIAPQSTTLSPNPRHKFVVTFNYADRGPEESMDTAPSVGKSAYLKIVPNVNQWAIVEPDFEGESAI